MGGGRWNRENVAIVGLSLFLSLMIYVQWRESLALENLRLGQIPSAGQAWAEARFQAEARVEGFKRDLGDRLEGYLRRRHDERVAEEEAERARKKREEEEEGMLK